jgi:biotin carboxyl carrier protein
VSTYLALLDGGRREEAVEVRRAGPGLYEVKLRGKVHVVDAYRYDHGTLSLVVDHASYSAMLDWRDTRVNVRLRHAVVPLEILDERRLRLRRGGAKLTVEGRQPVVARLPGRVLRVLVKDGDAVQAGQAIAVVEALEMENEVRSPKDGRVVELHVQVGQFVEGNAKLCAVE